MKDLQNIQMVKEAAQTYINRSKDAFKQLNPAIYAELERMDLMQQFFPQLMKVVDLGARLRKNRKRAPRLKDKFAYKDGKTCSDWIIEFLKQNNWELTYTELTNFIIEDNPGSKSASVRGKIGTMIQRGEIRWVNKKKSILTLDEKLRSNPTIPLTEPTEVNPSENPL